MPRTRVSLISLLFLISAFGFGAPKRLSTFADLLGALKSGHEVRAVIEYGKTSLIVDGKEEEAPKAIGGMAISPWEYFDRGVVRNEKAYVVNSETHLIAHAGYGYVNNYVRMRIYDDNSVEIVARYLTLGTQEVVMDETFKGSLSNGKDKNGVSLFAQ